MVALSFFFLLFLLYPESAHADVITPILAWLGSVGSTAGIGTAAVTGSAGIAAAAASTGAVLGGAAIVGGAAYGATKVFQGKSYESSAAADAAKKAYEDAEQKSLTETADEDKKAASRRALLSTPTSGFGPNTNLARSFLTSL